MRTFKKRVLAIGLGAAVALTSVPALGFAAAPKLPVGITAAYAATGDVEINEANFPDAAFREKLTAKFGGTVISASDREQLIELDLNDAGIQNLKGIECFENLSALYCDGNNLSALDVSKNTKLAALSCRNNHIKTIDLSNNPELTQLYIENNELTSLNLKNKPKLNWMSCQNNHLMSLDLTETDFWEVAGADTIQFGLKTSPQTRTISAKALTYDLAAYDAGLDGSRIKNLTNASLSGTKISNIKSKSISYEYDVPNPTKISEKMKVNLTVNYDQTAAAKAQYTKAVKAAKAKRVAGLKVKAGKSRSVIVTWKKTSGASGYQVYRAVKKTGKYKKVATLKKATKVKFINKKLKAKKNYYYKVRPYTKVKNTSGKYVTVYGKWTSVKKVTTRK